MDNQKAQNNSNLIVEKASGDLQNFDISKLKRSLLNAGADQKTVKEIVDDIQKWVFNGVTSRQIYTHAFSILHNDNHAAATLYKLKQAIMELGPTGYPFEQFTGQIFKKLGYEILVGVVVDGRCVTHEMDVVATREGEQCLVECKYGRDQGKHVSVQVPLYVRSRVDDIVQKRKDMEEYKGFSFQGWVVTNTRFSKDSIKYGTCSGLNLLAWDYPKGKGLKDLIEKYKLYPHTILHHLSDVEKQKLLEFGVVTCIQIFDNPSLLKSINLSVVKIKNVMSELKSMGLKE